MMAYDEEDEDEEKLKKEAKLEAYLAKKANPAKEKFDKAGGVNRKQRRAKEKEERKFDNDFKKINKLMEKRKADKDAGDDAGSTKKKPRATSDA